MVSRTTLLLTSTLRYHIGQRIHKQERDEYSLVRLNTVSKHMIINGVLITSSALSRRARLPFVMFNFVPLSLLYSKHLPKTTDPPVLFVASEGKVSLYIEFSAEIYERS